MSLSETSPTIPAPQAGDAVAAAPPARKLDIRALLADRTFQLCLIVIATVVFCFWPFFYQEVLKKWMDMEGYYAHGFLIPLCSAYLVWNKWDRIKDLPVKPAYWAAVPIAGTLYLTFIGMRCIMTSLLSGLMLLALWLSSLFVAGWKWAVALTAPIGFLILGLPVFDKLIDSSTGPLQEVSTKVAFKTLQLLGVGPIMDGKTTIYVPNFARQLDVAVACSGLKTTIAVSAAVIFFMLIARLRWWANLVLAALAIPLSVAINGFRIALIGLIANSSPEWAAEGDNFKNMHDFSGYVALFLCFVLLGWLTRRLGYK